MFTVREHHGTYYRYVLQDLWEGARTPIDAADIVRVRLVLAGKLRLDLARTEELNRSDVEFRGTSLSVVYPWASAPKPADPAVVTEFARSFGSLQGEVAVDANPADLSRYGLDKPSAELLLGDGQGNSFRVMTGKVERASSISGSRATRRSTPAIPTCSRSSTWIHSRSSTSSP